MIGASSNIYTRNAGGAARLSGFRVSRERMDIFHVRVPYVKNSKARLGILSHSSASASTLASAPASDSAVESAVELLAVAEGSVVVVGVFLGKDPPSGPIAFLMNSMAPGTLGAYDRCVLVMNGVKSQT